MEYYHADLENTMNEAEDDTSKPKLKGPLGYPLRSFRSKRDELDAVGLRWSLVIGMGCKLEGASQTDEPRRRHHT